MKSLHIGTNFGNNSNSSEVTADTRSGLENGKFLLIGSGKHKCEFFKLCFPGFQVFIMSFDLLKFTGLFRCDMVVNGFTEFRKFLLKAFINKGLKVKRSILRDFPKVYPVWLKQICRRCPKQRFPTGYWKP